MREINRDRDSEEFSHWPDPINIYDVNQEQLSPIAHFFRHGRFHLDIFEQLVSNHQHVQLLFLQTIDSFRSEYDNIRLNFLFDGDKSTGKTFMASVVQTLSYGLVGAGRGKKSSRSFDRAFNRCCKTGRPCEASLEDHSRVYFFVDSVLVFVNYTSICRCHITLVFDETPKFMLSSSSRELNDQQDHSTPPAPPPLRFIELITCLFYRFHERVLHKSADPGIGVLVGNSLQTSQGRSHYNLYT